VAVVPVLFRLARSGAAGLLATVADLGTLTVLVSVLGVSPRIANVPALVVGSVVMFFGQKYFAFQARGGRVDREVGTFALVQVVGLVLNAALFDVAMRIPGASNLYVVVRLVTNNLVWLFYSFPLWHFVFKNSRDRDAP
jgi:putative flippase GtrA